MKVMFETVAESMAVGSDEVGLHLRFTDHPIPAERIHPSDYWFH